MLRGRAVPWSLAVAAEPASGSHDHHRMHQIEHAERLVDLFGHWPSFHDAELRALRFDAQARGGAALEVDVDLAEFTGEVDARGHATVRQSCRTTLRFRNVNRVTLVEFRRQNVLDDLAVRLLDPPDPAEHVVPWGPRRLEVEFVPIPGFCALTFRCDQAEVARADSTLADPGRDVAADGVARGGPGAALA